MAYTFDPVTQRYRDARGRYVQQTTPQQALSTSLAKVARRTDQLAADLREGDITLAAWRVEMQAVIKQVHAAGAALARGGFDALDEDAVARLEETVTREYLYLEAWAADLAAGEAPMDGRMASRARLYVQGGRVTYHAERLTIMAEAGFDEVRSVLGEAEHCDLCVEQDALGWQPVYAFLPIGQRTCLANDACRVEFRKSGAPALARSALTADAPPARLPGESYEAYVARLKATFKAGRASAAEEKAALRALGFPTRTRKSLPFEQERPFILAEQPWIDALLPEQREALQAYTEPGGYYELNRMLRELADDDPEWDREVDFEDAEFVEIAKRFPHLTYWQYRDLITSAIASRPPRDDAVTVWRGIKAATRSSAARKALARQWRVGTIVDPKGLQSTSLDIGYPVAGSFHQPANREDRLVLEIRARSGLMLYAVSTNPNEMELLQNLDVRYRVVTAPHLVKFDLGERGIVERMVVQLEEIVEPEPALARAALTALEEDAASVFAPERLGMPSGVRRNTPAETLETLRETAFLDALTEEQQEAIQLYTGDLYQHLNDALREHPDPNHSFWRERIYDDEEPFEGKNYTWGEIRTLLSEAIDDRGEREPVIAWRNVVVPDGITGEQFLAEFTDGTLITPRGFQSTSLDPTYPVASGEGVIFEIRARTGLSVHDLSASPSEWELLQQDGVTYRVIGEPRRATFALRPVGIGFRLPRTVTRWVVQLEEVLPTALEPSFLRTHEQNVAAGKKAAATRAANKAATVAAAQAPPVPPPGTKPLTTTVLPSRPLGDTSPISLADAEARLKDLGLLAPNGYMTDPTLSTMELMAALTKHYQRPDPESDTYDADKHDPARIGSQYRWTVGRGYEWGSELKPTDAAKMLGYVTGEIEKLAVRYPGMSGKHMLDLVFVRSHFGGVTISPFSVEEFSAQGTYPPNYPASIVSFHSPDKGTMDIDTFPLRNGGQIFSQWADTGHQTADDVQRATVRHEMAHIFQTTKAMDAWEAALRAAKVPGAVATLNPTADALFKRHSWFRKMLGHYASQGSTMLPRGAMEEAAEAAAWVTAAHYDGSLPKPIEDWVTRLYNGEFL